jgi:hypothetical protein
MNPIAKKFFSAKGVVQKSSMLAVEIFFAGGFN